MVSIATFAIIQLYTSCDIDLDDGATPPGFKQLACGPRRACSVRKFSQDETAFFGVVYPCDIKVTVFADGEIHCAGAQSRADAGVIAARLAGMLNHFQPSLGASVASIDIDHICLWGCAEQPFNLAAMLGAVECSEPVRRWDGSLKRLLRCKLPGSAATFTVCNYGMYRIEEVRDSADVERIMAFLSVSGAPKHAACA